MQPVTELGWTMDAQSRTRKWHDRHEILIASLGVVSLVAMAGGVSTLLAANASGTPNVRVTICHATASASNPYTVNTIDAASIDEEGNRYLNGHGDHTGPVFAEGVEQWGDIIPPFTNPETGNSFPGYNWNDAGQAILGNDCVVVVPSPSPTETSPSPSPTETSPSPSPTETSPSPSPTETSASPSPTETTPAPPESSPSPVSVAPDASTPETPAPVGEPGEIEVSAPEMPAPVAVAPEYPMAPVATVVPAGSGPLVLSIAGILLLLVGGAGLAASVSWFLATRKA